MTVFDRIKTMNKDELQHLINVIYAWGHVNEQCAVDDTLFYKHFLDMPSNHMDSVIHDMDNLQLYEICVVHMHDDVHANGGVPRYLATKFFSVDDATQYLKKHNQFIIKVDSTTYVCDGVLYKIIEKR